MRRADGAVDGEQRDLCRRPRRPGAGARSGLRGADGAVVGPRVVRHGIAARSRPRLSASRRRPRRDRDRWRRPHPPRRGSGAPLAPLGRAARLPSRSQRRSPTPACALRSPSRTARSPTGCSRRTAGGSEGRIRRRENAPAEFARSGWLRSRRRPPLSFAHGTSRRSRTRERQRNHGPQAQAVPARPVLHRRRQEVRDGHHRTRRRRLRGRPHDRQPQDVPRARGDRSLRRVAARAARPRPSAHGDAVADAPRAHRVARPAPPRLLLVDGDEPSGPAAALPGARASTSPPTSPAGRCVGAGSSCCCSCSGTSPT